VLKAVDLFAGAGGFSLAAILAGFDIEFAVENDKHAVVTYQNNICDKYSSTNTTIYNQNIETLDPKKLNSKHFPNKNRCDLLLGGPPCQGFSTHRICDAGVDDPRNTLIHTYFDFVKTLTPRIFLMENVPGILWDRHKDYLKQFYAEGLKAGYKLFEPVVIDARDYGIPQRRKRVFILGLDRSVDTSNFIWPLSPTHIDTNGLDQKLNRKPWVSCASVFGKTDKDDANNQHMNHGEELIKAFKNTPINGGSRKDSGRILPCHQTHDGHKDVYGRIDPTLPAPTMTTACINPSKGRFVHPTEHHGITARQAARIQTFPDDFVFYGGLIASGKQIGNAVPVQLGRVIIKHISTLLNPIETESKTIEKEMEEFA
jgi:DNA (cytosine-5)-methyltransferase 1